MEKIELNDIQGIIVKSYKPFLSSRFLLCHINNIEQARKFIHTLLPRITKGNEQPRKGALNIAFTYPGVALFGLSLEKDFSQEFVEGMFSPHRQRILGDYNRNDPKNWTWGTSASDEIHFMLMFYGITQGDIDSEYNDIFNGAETNGIHFVKTLYSEKLPDGKEHFGFRDGISQPTIKGLREKREDSEENVVADGEFIFGYANEYNQLPLTPVLANGFDLGKNGSYMVFRQIEQDVKGFWEYMYHNSDNDIDKSIYLASKMLGRYPSGTPITLSPDADSPLPEMHMTNNFAYYKNDADGLKCPMGAHIRKANPRDGMNGNPEESVSVSKKHRILRRGRPYGQPLDPSMEPAKILAAPNPEHEVGLYFICFNTNIGRQFEFIQQQWMNNKKFDHLYSDADPLIGVDTLPPAHGDEKPDRLGEFTVQACPVRRKLHDVPQFTFIKGGAYFFMPGLGALAEIVK